MACVRLLVEGRVQGVSYRAAARAQALAFGLTGHARNLADGRVEVVACGDAAAVDALERLGERGLKDYFVVGASGQPNTISLGLFKDPTNARKRRDEVAQAGFPAQMVERTDTVPAYWLDLVVADGPRLDWRSRVHGEGLALRATGCF